jgi:hypothetical protein
MKQPGTTSSSHRPHHQVISNGPVPSCRPENIFDDPAVTPSEWMTTFPTALAAFFFPGPGTIAAVQSPVIDMSSSAS